MGWIELAGIFHLQPLEDVLEVLRSKGLFCRMEFVLCDLRGAQTLHGIDQPVIGICASWDRLDGDVGIFMDADIVIGFIQSGEELVDHPMYRRL